ncbi:MAG: SDR family NAD(P)-dependent oxidoreductase [Clostridia bacterium]|nr:SDR family NAD(P)-dependent oxidoreductase [Clostridia bacterium]
MTYLDELVELSNRYGSDPSFVLAGGGNTSFKTADELWVKGSGTALSSITKDGFVRMDRERLSEIWRVEYSSDPDKREAEVLASLMNARGSGEENKRPSVETLFHDLFPQSFVLHVHPSVVNGVLCAKNGKETIKRLFPDSIWLDACEPGYVMASAFRKALLKFKKATGKDADLVFHQNHGVFFAASTAKKLDALVKRVIRTIKSEIKVKPDFSDKETDPDTAASIAPVLRMLYDRDGNARVVFKTNKQIIRFSSREGFKNIKRPLTPDHIVYCKAEPLFISDFGVSEIIARFNEFKYSHGYLPKIVFAENIGMFAIGSTFKEANTASDLMFDAMTVVTYAENFGGVLPMSKKLTDFIVNWEVEKYRSGVSLRSGASDCFSSKIAIVTGGAQGFGEGIARFLASKGANVAIADINSEGAAKTAANISETTGAVAVPVTVNIADEESVRKMIRETVLTYGGLDVFVNNAGIVRAGSLEEMTRSNFDLVTSINYTAYFMCVKYASAVMKSQRAVNPSYMADIIEINSKSGLTGSNKNFAYAGSKFGGLGLTQSFALELAPFGIKVNAVCPGNFLDGPLWSDPVRGLFVQYLNAGKVPGAKTVADVKKYYESKVPLGRGCLPEDLNRAVQYIIEQKYETGQAVPVTGGQEMLN